MAPSNKGNLVSDGQVIKSLLVSFGDVELSRPDTAYVNEQRGGGKSTGAIIARVPVNIVGGFVLMLSSTIYGRLGTDGKLKFNPAIPKGLAFVGDDAKDAFKAHVNESVLAWSGKDRAFREAFNRLTAVKAVKGTKAAKAEDIEWTPEVETSASVTVAASAPVLAAS